MRDRKNLCFRESNRMSKKAQEEVVGFIFIVVIVAIIGVIILGVYLRSPSSDIQSESKDIYQFLESLMQYTTSCSKNYDPNYLELSELIQECNSGLTKCVSGEDTCKILDRELKELLDSSFKPSQDSPIKGYELTSVLSANVTREIVSIKEGECGSVVKGSEILSATSDGAISTTLKLCY